MVQIAYVPNAFTPIFSVIPLVFVFLWTLIVGDFKNFAESRRLCSAFTAEDPINCYQNYAKTNGNKQLKEE